MKRINSLDNEGLGNHQGKKIGKHTSKKLSKGPKEA